MKYFCFLLILFKSVSVAASNDYVIWDRNYDDAYTLAFIINVMELSKPKYGDYRLTRSAHMEQDQALETLKNGTGVDFLVVGATTQREAELSFVYVPVDRGLLGFRVCLINKKTLNLKQVRTFNDLNRKNIRFGLGTDWPDVPIFQKFGANLVLSEEYSALFGMLSDNQFECLSRSLNEIDKELIEHSEKNFSVEKDLLFVYSLANFMATNKADLKLNERLKYGIDKAIENNSFYSLFDEYFNNKFIQYNIYQRRLLFLDNDDMTESASAAINTHGIASFLANK